MKNFLLFISFILLIITVLTIFISKKCTAKNYSNIDEKYAAMVVKKELSLSEFVTAEELKGGYSGNPTFIVTSGLKKYVIRFFVNKTKEYVYKEISCMKAASDGNYGPHIYLANIEKAFVIMEFLTKHLITPELRQSDKFYIMLANLLKKIHNGPKYQNSLDNFDIIQEQIKELKTKNNGNIPLAKIEEIVTILRKTLAHNQIFVPCHNDMHPNNLLFLGNEFKAIDYEFAGQGDPYFDIAMVTLLHCFSSEHENILLSTYFGRKPLLQEDAKIYLMKQVFFVMLSLLFFTLVPDLSQYDSLVVPTYSTDFFKKMSENQNDFWQDLSNAESKLKFSKILINYVVANFDSQEFKNAINLLMEN